MRVIALAIILGCYGLERVLGGKKFEDQSVVGKRVEIALIFGFFFCLIFGI